MVGWEVGFTVYIFRDAPAVSVRNDTFAPYGRETGFVLVNLLCLICKLLFFNSYKGDYGR